MTYCDRCEIEFKMEERHVSALPRPSNPSEIVAVLWYCPECGKKDGLPTAKEIVEAVEEGKEVNGRKYLFVTV